MSVGRSDSSLSKRLADWTFVSPASLTVAKVQPENLMASWKTGLMESSWLDGNDPLACNCLKYDAVHHCEEGGKVSRV